MVCNILYIVILVHTVLFTHAQRGEFYGLVQPQTKFRNPKIAGQNVNVGTSRTVMVDVSFRYFGNDVNTLTVSPSWQNQVEIQQNDIKSTSWDVALVLFF